MSRSDGTRVPSIQAAERDFQNCLKTEDFHRNDWGHCILAAGAWLLQS
jgi:hypothetical protein